MVLDFNDTLTKQKNGNLVINNFLDEYQNLFLNLKSAFTDRQNGKLSFNERSYHVSQMKIFVINRGGLRCVELLAEYEKNYSIGDFISCSSLEKKVLIELHFFKEFWISMLS